MDAYQQDAVVAARRGVRPEHCNVHVAAHLEHVGGAGAVERREAAGAAVGRAGRLKAAVLVDADQLDGAVAVPRGHGGVRVAAHLESIDGTGEAKGEAAGAVGRRAGRLEGAVIVDANQLDAVDPEESARGHHGVRAVVHLEHVDGVGATEQVEAAGAVGRRAGRLEAAIFVYAYQLDAVVMLCDHHGVCAAAHLERVDIFGAVERVEYGGGRRLLC